VFIVHGRNSEVKETVSRFLTKLDLEPIILHEQPNAGKTIIEKFLDYADVSFAIILMTPDDKGGLTGDGFEKQKPRARQNVILEMGFFLGKIGRERTCIIYDQSVEIPSDYDGVLYIPYDDEEAWQLKLAKEMKNASLPFDMNALVN
jgi:predicted nucleotide-binding protein